MELYFILQAAQLPLIIVNVCLCVCVCTQSYTYSICTEKPHVYVYICLYLYVDVCACLCFFYRISCRRSKQATFCFVAAVLHFKIFRKIWYSDFVTHISEGKKKNPNLHSHMN